MLTDRFLTIYEDQKLRIGRAPTEVLVEWEEGRADGMITMLFRQELISVDFYKSETDQLRILSKTRREELKQ